MVSLDVNSNSNNRLPANSVWVTRSADLAGRRVSAPGVQSAPPPPPTLATFTEEVSEDRANNIIKSYEDEEPQPLPRWKWIKAEDIIQIRPSQDSVDYSTRKGRVITIDNLAKEIYDNKWRKYEAIAAVRMPVRMPKEEIIVSADNRRLTAAYKAVARSVIPVLVHERVFAPDSDYEVLIYNTLSKNPELAETRQTIQRFAQRYSHVAITSYDLPHADPIDTRIVSDIEDLNWQFKSFHGTNILPILPSTLNKGELWACNSSKNA